MATNGIILAPISRNDLSTLQRFRNSPEVYEHVRERRLLTIADMEKWWEMLAADYGHTVRMFAVKIPSAHDLGGTWPDGQPAPAFDLIGSALAFSSRVSTDSVYLWAINPSLLLRS